MPRKQPTPRDIAIQHLFSRPPDQRFKPTTVLDALAEKYPSLMRSIAEHVANRCEELGDNPTAGQLVAMKLESETLGLHSCLSERLIQDGLFDDKGQPNPLLWAIMRLGDQVLKWSKELGIKPDEQANPAPVDISATWAKALPSEPTDTEAQPACQCGDGCACKEPVDNE